MEWEAATWLTLTTVELLVALHLTWRTWRRWRGRSRRHIPFLWLSGMPLDGYRREHKEEAIAGAYGMPESVWQRLTCGNGSARAGSSGAAPGPSERSTAAHQAARTENLPETPAASRSSRASSTSDSGRYGKDTSDQGGC